MNIANPTLLSFERGFTKVSLFGVFSQCSQKSLYSCIVSAFLFADSNSVLAICFKFGDIFLVNSYDDVCPCTVHTSLHGRSHLS